MDKYVTFIHGYISKLILNMTYPIKISTQSCSFMITCYSTCCFLECKFKDYSVTQQSVHGCVKWLFS